MKDSTTIFIEYLESENKKLGNILENCTLDDFEGFAGRMNMLSDVIDNFKKIYNL